MNAKERVLKNFFAKYFKEIDYGALLNIIEESELLSIEDQLEYIFFKSGYKTMWVEIPHLKLYQIPLPFIFKEVEKERLKITKIETIDKNILYKTKNLKSIRVLLLEKLSHDFKLKNKNYNFLNVGKIIFLSVIAVILLIFILDRFKGNLFNWVFFISSGTGILYSIFILENYFLHTNSVIYSKLCELKSNCKNILEFNVSKYLISDLKFLMLFYFFSLFISSLFCLINKTIISNFLLLHSLAAILGILSSAFLQVYLKSLCRICILVVLLILTPFIFFIFFDATIVYKLQISSIIVILGSFIFSALIYFYYFQKSEIRKNKTELCKIKTDHKLFSDIIHSLPIGFYPPQSQFLPLKYISQKKELKITLIISLSCRLCSNVLNSTIDYFQQFKNFNLEIWFASDFSPANLDKVFLNKILAKEVRSNLELVKQLTINYIENKECDLEDNHQETDNFIKGVAGVPIIFLNNKRIPRIYNIEDVTFVLNKIN